MLELQHLKKKKKAAFQDYFGGRNQIQSCSSPFLTKSIYPTKFNPILEYPDHA